MFSKIKKYFYLCLISMKSNMEYRVDFILSIFSALLPILIQVFLWRALYKNSEIIYGYTFEGMISYVILAGITSKCISAGFEWDIARDIKQGRLSNYLISPINYCLYRISVFIGVKIVHFVIIGGFFTTALLFFHFYFGTQFTLFRIIAFIMALILATILNFLFFYLVGLFSFWLTDIYGIISGFNLAISIISGAILPLEIFGKLMQNIFQLLPFQYTIYFTMSILNSRLSQGEVFKGILIQIAWIIIIGILSRIIWFMGLKKYIAAGG